MGEGRRLAVAGVRLLVAGWGLGELGRLPESSSGSGRRAGCSSAAAGASCCWPAFYAVIDVRSAAGRWAFPLRGDRGELDRRLRAWPTCSTDFILGSFRTHLGPDVFQSFGTPTSRWSPGRRCCRLLAHPVLDVPSPSLLEDLKAERTLVGRAESSRPDGLCRADGANRATVYTSVGRAGSSRPDGSSPRRGDR